MHRIPPGLKPVQSIRLNGEAEAASLSKKQIALQQHPIRSVDSAFRQLGQHR
jgi:hypothetical protein